MISFSYLSIRRIRVVRLPFFSEISRPQKKVFPRRFESIPTGKPALLRSDFPCSSVAAGVTPAILRCLLRVAGQFGRETGRGSAVLDPELWINPLEMFPRPSPSLEVAAERNRHHSS